jgi:hypothetical protein
MICRKRLFRAESASISASTRTTWGRQELDNPSQNPAGGSQAEASICGAKETQMNSAVRPTGGLVSRTEEMLFKFENLEITRNALLIRFFEEKTVVPLKEIAWYHFSWYLHDPTFAKKWWFLVLTVTLKNGDEESGHVTSVKFNYLSDDSKLRKDIENKIAHAIDTALLRACRLCR